MSTLLHAIYDDPRGAEQAIQELVGIGISRDAVFVITDAMSSNSEGRAHMGSFADSGEHTHNAERDHVGSFADSGEHTHNAERDHVGSFADSGAHMHDATRDRIGSFAGSASAAPNDMLSDDLVRAGLSHADAQAAAGRLGSGAMLVLVRVQGDAVTRATAILQSAH